MRIVSVEPSESLLQNSDFETLDDGKLAGWRAGPKGFQLGEGEGRDGSRALVCRNETGEGWFGASQTVVLNQATAAPLVIEGWSKAAGVTGGSDNDYSLYADLTFADGTPLWGQTARFRSGTHDWQQRRLVILPDKPVKSVTLHCLFRGHGGAVWFDDVVLRESRSGSGAMMFQGAAVKPVEASQTNRGANERTLETGDGLKLVLSETDVRAVQAGTREFRDRWAGGFLVRDAAAESDYYPFREGSCPDLQLKLTAEIRGASNHIVIQGRISDTSAKDRAVTLVFAVPAGGTGWTWGDDIRRVRRISGDGEFANQVAVPCGSTGTQSLYPIAPVWDEQTGLAVGLDMARPAVYRVGYHAGLDRLFIAFDLGLSTETQRFPSSADFGFVLYRFDPANGFRGAWQKYTEIFPEHFRVRSKEQGLWMPFTDVSKVQGWQDFGFRYHEGNNNVTWDDAHGVLSFRYTEPMTWWMPMAKEVPRVLGEALRVRDTLEAGTSNRRRMAEVTRLAAMHDETGEPELLFRDTPWANGAVWSLNPNPWLGLETAADDDPISKETASSARPGPASPMNAATVHWNPELKERLYGEAARGSLDGEYLDSLEGYVTADLNFRREHFKSTTVPLTFSHETKRLVLFKGLAIFEFTRWLAEDVHRMGKLMFANSVPYRFTYLCPWLDVMGTETDWLRAGKYQPSSLETMDLWRALSGGKPYLLLMNTDYDQFTPDLVEKYFNRALYYGMWPGFFSHNASENPYWLNPRWYERDRSLFRKYIPLIKQVAEAGWRPVPHARSANANLLVERFGPSPKGECYLTLFNDTDETQTGSLVIEAAAFGFRSSSRPKALLGAEPEKTTEGWSIDLPAGRSAVWRLGE